MSPPGIGVCPGARQIDPSGAILGLCRSGEWGDRLAEMSELWFQLCRYLSGRWADSPQHSAGGLWPLPFHPLVFPSHLVTAPSLIVLTSLPARSREGACAWLNRSWSDELAISSGAYDKGARGLLVWG